MTYRIVGQGGSGSVRKRALIAALDGEVKARRQGETGRASLAPANYEFLPAAPDGGEVKVRLRPRRKDSMLIDGSMTLASETGDLLSVEGRLVKPPSFWTRQVDVVRRYARIGNVRVPVSMNSSAQVLIMGASTLNMSYRYLSVNGVAVPDAGDADPTGACGAATQTADLTAAARRARERGRLPLAPVARRGE